MKKKNVISIGCLLLGLSVCVSFTGNYMSSITAGASDALSVEIYTQNDKLINSDGSLSSRNIQDFATDVKSAASNADCSEITQVIPKQYMESTTTNAVYQYNGAEYGFYMVKEGEYFDLLLIDFTYVFTDGDDHNNDYKLRVEPILQQSFVRESTSNGYIWKKYGGTNRYTYYVANPRFANVLQNENQLNCGDLGYSKQEDTGVIIQQTRLNYGKISYKTESDLLELVAEFTLEKMVDTFITDPLDDLTGGISGYIEDCAELYVDIYEQGKEQTVPANNEVNILTQQSRTDQLNNADCEGFSRVVLAQPKEEVILSEADDSYAECIVLLNDTNAKARLTQICDFDIVKRIDNWSSMEYVPQVETGKDFSVSKQRILFDSETIVDEDTMEYYTLANGVHKFSFTPEYSGNYTINSGNTNVLITLDGVAKNSSNITQWMEAGTEYIIGFTATQTVLGTGTIEVSTLQNSVSIASGKNYVGKKEVNSTGIYTISAGTANIYVYEDLFTGKTLVDTGTGTLDVLLKQGEKYYIVLQNSSSSTISSTVSVGATNLTEVASGQSISVALNQNTAKFIKINVEMGGQYDISFYCEDIPDLEVDIYSAAGSDASFDRADGTEYAFVRTSNLSAGTYYIRLVASANATIDCVVNPYTSEYVWKIDGVVFNEHDALRRGHSYALKIYNSNNQEIKNRKMAVKAPYVGYVTVDQTSDGYILTISPSTIMYDDQLVDYCEIYILDDKNISREFIIIYKNESIMLSALPYSIDNPNPTINFTVAMDSSEVAYVGLSYCFKSNSDLNGTTVRTHEIVISGNASLKPGLVQYKISNLTGYNSSCYFLRNATIDYIIFKDGTGAHSSILGRVYNSNLTSNAQQINTVQVNTINNQLYFSSGSGTSADPYVIMDYLQFNKVNSILSIKSNTYFTLQNNITVPSGASLVMVNNELNGNFQGNDYGITCSSFVILTSGNLALFETIGVSGGVYDLYLTFTYNISAGSGKYVGSVAITNHGVIENCTIRLTYEQANPGEYVGGVVADNQSLIRGCIVRGSINGGAYLGGIAAYNQSTITNCVADIQLNYTYKIENSDYIGGIAGYSLNGSVINNEYNGLIYIDVEDWNNKDYAPYVGGIIGYVSGNTTLIANTFTGSFDIDNLNPEVKTGLFGWGEEHNQQQNVSDTYNP